jgi:hypothetical protein
MIIICPLPVPDHPGDATESDRAATEEGRISRFREAETLEAAVVFGAEGDEDGIRAARDIAADTVVYSVVRKEVTRLV